MPELDLPWGETFVIDRYEPNGSTVELHYTFGDPEEPSFRFVETIEFESEVRDTPQLRAALRVLHLLAGVSYYKSVAPTRIQTPLLSEAERALMLAMYDEGLREFAYRNDLGVPIAVELDERPDDGSVQANNTAPESSTLQREGVEPRVLIPIGGGKDSALVADLVPKGELMAVSPKGAQEHLASHLGRPLLRVQRNLDPQLKDLVAAGALNGHVPVTAINSAIAVALAVSSGFDEVLMGLERSASEPSLVVDGVEVNHQFSKSARAEQLLADAFEPTGVRYLSLLRPMTELAIGAAVGARGLAADIVSCNRVFTIWSENDSSRTQRPCGECAKCLFTALMLAPALSPDQVSEYFGRDLLDEEEHLDPVRELWSAEKPFDCVGERRETAAAVALLAQRPEWQDQLVPAKLAAEALGVLAEVGAKPDDYLQIDSVDDLPERYRSMIRDLGQRPG
ncbi:MAG TPA: hypothetical protein VL068_01290 [Microthrixaceae bacterium]|nr:hypothetical protein [Microthrixaceae bacterium]